MLARDHLTILVSLSVASALILSGVVVEAASSHAAPAGLSSAALPSTRRAVVWYGVPEAAPRTLTLQSTSVNASVQDEYQITYSGGNFTLIYQRVAGGPITSRYTLSVEGLVEWNSTGSDGAFEGENVVAYTPLGPGAFGRFPVVHAENTTSGGVTVHTFTIGFAERSFDWAELRHAGGGRQSCSAENRAVAPASDHHLPAGQRGQYHFPGARLPHQGGRRPLPPDAGDAGERPGRGRVRRCLLQPLQLGLFAFEFFEARFGNRHGILGLGAKPPAPEWGAMVGDAVPFLRQSPYLVFFPGIASSYRCPIPNNRDPVSLVSSPLSLFVTFPQGRGAPRRW